MNKAIVFSLACLFALSASITNAADLEQEKESILGFLQKEREQIDKTLGIKKTKKTFFGLSAWKNVWQKNLKNGAIKLYPPSKYVMGNTFGSTLQSTEISFSLLRIV